MKAISLWQPYASLVVHDAKSIETRKWNTNFRGQLLIHAAQNQQNVLTDIIRTEPFLDTLISLGYKIGGNHSINGPSNKVDDLPRGAIIGSVRLVNCVPTDNLHVGSTIGSVYQDRAGVHMMDTYLTQREFAFGDYRPGRFAWILVDPICFKNPIPWTGRQGLFNVLPKYRNLKFV